MRESVSRTMVAVVVLGASLLAAGEVATASVLAGPLTNPGNGHEYYLLSAQGWPASEAEAVALGGHLVTIDDQIEADWVTATFFPLASGQGNLWIGLNDADIEGTFVWSSGAAVDYLDWAPAQPDDLNSAEDYAHIFGPGRPESPQWNDFNAAGEASTLSTPHGVVEVVPHGVANPPMPESTRLTAAPNPFNPTITIAFTATPRQSGSIVIYDLRGGLVRRLHSGPFDRTRFTWDGADNGGSRVSSGVYVVRAEADATVWTTKIALVE